jgi:hypothetical protein
MSTVAFVALLLLALAALAAQHAYWRGHVDHVNAHWQAIHDEETGRLADNLAWASRQWRRARQDAQDWRNMHAVEQERANLNAAEADRYRRAFTSKVLHEARAELVHPDAPWGRSNVVVIDEARLRRDLGLRGAR